MLRIPPRWRRTALTVSELERRLTPAGGIAAGSGWTVWNPTPAAGVTTDLPSTVWQPTADGVVARQDQAGPQWILPLTLDEPTMLSALAEAPAEADYQAGDKPLVIALPRPDGRLERFELWSVPTLHPELAAQFPGIHTFRGRGIDDPTAILAADFTDQGFHAAVSGDGSGYTIEPITAVSTGAYAAFFHADYLPHHGGGCGCEACHAAAAVLAPPPSGPSPAEFTNGANLRTFRLAVAATG